jgi:hypothetical protein
VRESESQMKPTLSSAIAAFGAKAKEKLANPAASGRPEDPLWTPFEQLLSELSEISDFGKAAVSAMGESSVSDLKTRPDFAVTVHNALVGFVELKAPAREQTRASSKTRTTSSSGKNLARYPTLSTPTATPSAFGKTGSW